MILRSIAILACTALCVLTACKKDEPAPPPPPAQEPVAEKTPAPPPTSDPRCMGPITTGAPRPYEISGKTWELNGSTLKLMGESASLRLGVITDLKENSPENLENIAAFSKWFTDQKVDAVVVAGDTGLTKEEIAGNLQALARLPVAVFVIIGNREGRAAYKDAVTEIRKTMTNVFDLNTVRRVDTGAVDIVSLPGYFNTNYIHSEDGCSYSTSDVDALGTVVAASDSPVLLVSHGGPKQEGEGAIDRTAEGENVGDPALTAFIQKNKIPFGIFGNIHEAGGRATDLGGKTLVQPKTPSDALYLNPGPADGVRWMMNDKTESVGMAALLTIEGGKATYEIHRIQAGPAGE